MALVLQCMAPGWTPPASTTVPCATGTDGTRSTGNSSVNVEVGPGSLLTQSMGGSININLLTGNAGILNSVGVATVEAWIRLPTLSGTQTIFEASTNASSQNPRLRLAVNSSGQLVCSARAGDAETTRVKTSTSAVVAALTHTHVAAVVDYANDAISLYVNGSLVSSTGTTTFTATTTGGSDSLWMRIGISGNFGGADFFTGRVGDVRVYNSDESANLATHIADAGALTWTNYTTTNLAPYWGPARVNDGVANSGRFSGNSTSATCHLVITGTKAVLNVGAQASQPYNISVDGGAYSTPTILGPTTLAGQITLFTGLSDAAHTVDIRTAGGYSGGNAWFQRPNALEVAGASPTISADPNYGPSERVSDTTLGDQNLGTTTTGYSSPSGGYDRGGESYSRRGKAERIYAWAGPTLATGGIVLLIDGVYQSITSLPTSGAHGWQLLASGLDSSAEHEYTIAFSKIGPSSDGFIDAVMFGGSGAELSATAVAAKPRIAVWGDSITHHAGCGTYGMGNGWLARLQRALDIRVHNRGVSGNTVTNVNARLASELAAIVAVSEPDIIIHNIGFNDASGATFKTNYRTMVDTTLAGTTTAKIICLPPWAFSDAAAMSINIQEVVTEVASDRVFFMSSATMPPRTTGSGNSCDNVHPTDSGAQAWADWMVPLLEPYLATGGSNYTTPVQGPYFSPGFSPANPPLIGIL